MWGKVPRPADRRSRGGGADASLAVTRSLALLTELHARAFLRSSPEMSIWGTRPAWQEAIIHSLRNGTGVHSFLLRPTKGKDNRGAKGHFTGVCNGTSHVVLGDLGRKGTTVEALIEIPAHSYRVMSGRRNDSGGARAPCQEVSQRPNVLFILTDDKDEESLARMDNVLPRDHRLVSDAPRSVPAR
jgi:hypothetical protein